MCGIAGAAWTSAGVPIDGPTLERMADSLAHRGPDGAGYHRSRGVALAHRRLAVIDVDGGAQPMSNEDESVHVVFNGEIYNYRDLRSRLSGHRFRTESDTEVLVHLYEERGVDFLRDLRGMFAIALWDARRSRLVLARDRMGQKPLVYRLEPGRILFASEAKAILQAPGVPRAVDPTALCEYLVYQYVPRPRTMFRGMNKLAPGCFAVFEDGRLEIDRYWTPDLNARTTASYADSKIDLRRRLEEATRLQLRSDVPLGAFLSGGVDSTIVAGLMQRSLDRPVKTFSIGFPQKEYDETDFARAAAAHLGTEHHEFQATPDALAMLPQIVWHYDEPFGDSSAIPTMLVSEMTRRHVTVALTGDGGDELFAGYPRFGSYAQLERIDRSPWPIPQIVGAGWWKLLPAGNSQHSIWRKLRTRLSLLQQNGHRRYLSWVRLFSDEQLGTLLSPGFRQKSWPVEMCRPLLEAFDQCADRDPLTQATFVDMQTYLPDCLLAKVDVASMAYGLECRSPFLDHEVVEYAASLRTSYKVRGGVLKRILVDACSDLMPEAIRRRGKMGFRVPLDHWFRRELRDMVHDVLLSSAATSRGYFQRGGVERLLDEHDRRTWNHGDRLWSLLVLELWHRAFIDAPAPPSGPSTIETRADAGLLEVGAGV